MAVPVVAKMPAPIVAPTPSAVRCHLVRVRRSPPRSTMSLSQSATDFRTKIEVMEWGCGVRDRPRARAGRWTSTASR